MVAAWCASLVSCESEESPVTYHFFRVRSCPQETHGNWQDTSFVVATANPAVVAQCRNQLALPYESRTLFPFGDIVAGSAGYNQNHTHAFNWHYKEDAWELVELGAEIYDGCAYTDAELGNYEPVLGRYGGWGNRLLEEIPDPVLSPLDRR